VAGRFPLYTDADVHQPVIDALRAHGWDVVLAVDTYPEGTKDEVHFEHTATTNRVLVTNDRRVEAIASQWLQAGRTFRGLILWPQRHYKRMGIGEIVEQIEALFEPLPHRVIHLKPAK
jgi:hypothetical protein